MTAREDRRPIVCFVLPSLAGGGAERVAVQVLNALDPDRWHRSMYLLDRSGPYLDELSPSVRLDAGTSRSRIARWWALRRYIRRTRPDVIVAFLSYVTVLTAVRAAGAGGRVIFALGTPLSAFLTDADYRWSRPWNRRLFAWTMRIACAVTDLVVATSHGVADDLIASFGGRPARVRVVNNPVDLGQIASGAQQPIDAADTVRWQPPVVITAGRLAEVKNHALLIEAFAILRQRIAASLFILGEGDHERAVRGLIAQRGLDGSVHLCGFRTNPWSYIARADVFALTSRYEGFGNVLVEAMACGVPVVATGSPGTREIVTPEVNGLIVERHDPAAFADALARVLEDSLLRRRLAERARADAEQYRTEKVALAYDRLFMEVLV
jgi:glycosyltransferase involved in cell wall biosynthesis